MTRNDYIGGSDAAAILCRHDYRSRGGVWRMKRGETSDMDLSANRHVMRGNELEPMVERHIREHLDPSINSPENWKKHDAGVLAGRRIPNADPGAQIMLMDPRPHPLSGRPYIGGHPDGVGDEILWEIKCPTSKKFGLMARYGVPNEWLDQVQHYLRMSGLQKGCIVIWSCDDWEPVLVWVDADVTLHEHMREDYEHFWGCVISGEEPSNGSDAQDHEVIICDDEETAEIVALYKSLTTTKYETEKRIIHAKMRLVSALGPRRKLITPDHTVTLNRTTNKNGVEATRIIVSENAPDAEE